MAQKQILVKNYCITLNNYTSEQLISIKGNIGEIAKYAIIGEEVGESGTPHLQGYIQLLKKTDIKTVHKWWDKNINIRPHIESAKGNAKDNYNYCTKENKYWEYGELRTERQRTDVKEFLKAAEELEELELARAYPLAYSKYHKAAARIKDLADNEKDIKEMKEDYKDCVLRTWQEQALQSLLSQDNRKILWIVDTEGNQGKTWFAKYLVAEHQAFYINGGKNNDIAYAYKKEPIVIFDFTRQQQEIVNYNLMESFKNGMIWSGKYDSKNKIKKNIKLLCLSNFHPDTGQMSQDRWNIVVLENITN